MPNHAHCLIHIKEGGDSLNKLVANGKRFMAYDIVKRLNSLYKQDILQIFVAGVQPNEQATGKKHKVFRLPFDAKCCFSESMKIQKLD